MRNDSTMPLLWIAVGSLALATMVLVGNYQKTPLVSQVSPAQNTANVCSAAAEALMRGCESLAGGDAPGAPGWEGDPQGPSPANCCTFAVAAFFASCTGNPSGYSGSLARRSALLCPAV